MTTNLAIFKNPNAVVASTRASSALGQQIAANLGGLRRIQTNTNGTFKRIVNGEQIGRAIRGEFNAIIVAQLPKVSRTFYASDYDPDAKPALPDCWSNLGDKPDAKAPNPQGASCASCPKDVVGSGKNGNGRACRFQRRIAILLEGDTSGDVYQLNIPGKSLFGKGDGNTHPYESYGRYLVANGSAPDLVVTTVAYDLDADTMELQFTPVRPITDEEYDLVLAAQADPETQRYIQLTVSEAAATKEEPTAKPKAKEEPKPAPKKQSAATQMEMWGEAADAEEAEEVEAPKATKRATKATPEPKAATDLAAVVNAWATDEDD